MSKAAIDAANALAEDAKAASSAQADDEEEDEDDIPADPAARVTLLKKLRKTVRKLEKQLDEAGLTKKDEKRLTDEVALLSAKIDALTAAAGAEPTPAPSPAPAPIVAAPVVFESAECPWTVL